MTTTQHEYETRLSWPVSSDAGSTGGGVRGYSRDHEVTVPGVEGSLAMTADPAFRGDASRLNPEQMLVAAASSCQMLSFLGAAARAGVDVVGYGDTAASRLLLQEAPARLDTLRLDITVQVAAGTEEGVVQDLARQAHEQCFIANSLAIPVELTVTVDPV
ncbi:OsmC family protein [Nesterenkonia xinjiangensis]|uniref:Organic hydroperoxide reductase OsmC/OhrA n=1 Tax=Nesterenkonia xinjiangensis TaxID=225327 RepID=A0A7Z0GK78_9MICC|nr:OsmC family protein [Nesterenkonia xinjiangensis]NYJ77472.1 organic hydroperoxide reductase OsmC/OhrA [Nesterenkonia xinjiangensis]